MKMMRSLFACRRIASVRIKSRANSLLDALNHGLVLEFDAMKICSRPRYPTLRFVPHIGKELDDTLRRLRPAARYSPRFPTDKN